MKKLLFIVTLLSLTVANVAEAQFWKRKKEEPPKRRPVQTIKTEEKKEPSKLKKKREIEYPKTVIKSRYRIDVLLSLYLDELVKDNKPVYKNYFPDKAVAGINLYEGIKLAADTLSKQGYNLDIHIHDITQAGLSPEQIVKENILDGSDLIIGGVQSYQIKPIADYAKKHQINFISMLSPADADVTNNPYFTILQPTLVTHIKKLRADIFKKYPGKNIFLFYRTTPDVDSTAFKYAWEDEEKNFKRLLVNKMPTFSLLEKMFDSTETNIIFMPIVDYSYSQNLIEELYTLFPDYSFEVYGLPSWRFMSKLKKADAYPNVGVNYSNPFYYDMNNKYCLDIANAYKANFAGKITELSLRGYEATMWYAYLLKRYGTVFNEKLRDNHITFSKYEVFSQWTTDNDLLYNENTHYYIYRYQGGSFMISE